MSEIHIGPHTRDSGDAHGHGHADNAHTYDREINLKAIAKWMGGLVVLAVIVQIAMFYMIRGLDRSDARKDRGMTPIEREMKQPAPPAPRLQVGENFDKLNKDNQDVPPGTRSDREDMQALREEEDRELGTPAWKNQAQGTVRLPINVAMKVIASRGPQIVGGPPPVPQEH
ncbi:MAG TPA: hypothetical protein VEW48_23455 [Thermoanaerobaculia bacterium]|nr:hypothetical protein [Thermoanaerobaculia bacterium]